MPEIDWENLPDKAEPVVPPQAVTPDIDLSGLPDTEYTPVAWEEAPLPEAIQPEEAKMKTSQFMAGALDFDADMVYSNIEMLDELPDQETIAQFKKRVESIVKPVPALAAVGYLKAASAVAGFVGAEAEEVDIDVITGAGFRETKQSLAERWREEVNIVNEQIMKENPLERNSWSDATRNAFISIYTQAPAYGVGLLLRGRAVALGMMGTQAGLEKGAELQEGGYDNLVAIAGTLASGTSEVLTEMIPFDAFVDIVRKSPGMGKNLVKLFLGEQVGEQINTVVDSTIDKITINKDMTWDEYLDRVEMTAKATLVQSMLMGGGAASARILIERGDMETTIDDMPEEVKAQFEEIKAEIKGDEIKKDVTALNELEKTAEGKAYLDAKIKAEGIPTTEQVLERITTEELTDEQLTEMLDIFAEGQEIIAEDVEAVSEIKNRLIDIGMPEEEASSNAALYAGFDVLAKRAGVPLDDLITRYLPEISQRDMIPEITDEDRRIVADNPVLNNVITDEAQLESFDELRAIRNDLETELEANRDTWSQEQVTQQEEAIDYLNTKVTEEQLIGGIPRGRIRFYSDKVNIDLLKDADQSTFVHETGHLYLMMMNDLANVETASQELKDDFEIIKDWLGVVDGEITRDQNEQFARGFEAYLREGKAPTPALKKAFENFKKWLMEIYRSLSDLDVELTDDVRGAMDRMFIDEGMEAPVRGEVAAAPGVTVRDADGVTYDQEGVAITNTTAFRKWSEDGEIVEPEDVNDYVFKAGEPVVLKVFHGTTHKFDAFDAKRGNLESQFGAVNYFTSSEQDATDNYAGEGPDLTNRIEQRAEQLEQNIEQYIGEDADFVMQELGITKEDAQSIVDGSEVAISFIAKNKARQELSGGEMRTLELFVKVKNPFVIGENAEWIEFVDNEAIEEQAIMRVAEEHDLEPSEVEERRDEFEDQIDEARWEIESEEPHRLAEAIQTVSDRYDVDASNLAGQIYELGSEARPEDIEQLLRSSEDYVYAEGPEGELIQSQLISEVIEELGFDSIILRDANKRFATMNIEPGTAHVHVFDSNRTNIKSVENKGTFDPGKPSIYEQPPTKTTFKEETEPTFSPREVTSNPVPADILENPAKAVKNYLPSHAEKGQYFYMTADDLQAHLDKHGDGFLYRVGDRRSVEGGFERGKQGYLHKFATENKKTLALNTSLEGAKKYLASSLSPEYNIIYRIMPQDLADDFIIHIPSNEAARNEGDLIIHSPKPASTSMARVLYSQGNFTEEDTDVSRRAIEERRAAKVEEGAERAAGVRVRPGVAEGRPGRVGSEAEAGKPVITRNKKGEVFYQSAFHGTPHKFDKFTLDHIGKGEGAQTYGWGLYFAENKDVAEFYRKTAIDPSKITIKKLSPEFYENFDVPIGDIKTSAVNLMRDEAVNPGTLEQLSDDETYKGILAKAIIEGNIIREGGALLKVELAPKADEWLDWDKPLSEQSKTIKDILKKEGISQAYKKNLDNFASPQITRGREIRGSNIYEFIQYEKKMNPEEASLYLRSIGIPGIRYLDATSRGKERGTSNYVVFDESLIEIQEFMQAPKKPSKITNIRQLAKSLGGIDYNRENLKGELRKLIEDAPATRYIINRKNQGVPLDRLLENAIEAGILSETATLDDLLEALKTNLKTPEAIQAELEKEERAEKRIEEKAQKIEDLRRAFVDMAKKARQAYKEGKDYAAVKEARKLKNILARARKIRIVRDYFNLSDADLKKISRKNPLLMSQYEFKLYLDDVRNKAVRLSEETLQKAMLINLIHEKDLNRVDNYRRALGFPIISKMTVAQVQSFADLLEPFHDGDTFLSERELETVDRTDLKGIATWREARERLAKEVGVSVEELSKIKVKEWDEYKWDTALAEANPFYKMLVTETTRKLLEADMRTHDIENEVFELARKSEKSRGRTLAERAIPQDKQIMEYLETPVEERDALISDMTPEQVDLAHYMESYFANALEYLIQTKALSRGRENYFVHMRRTFLENVKEEGILGAFRDLFKTYQEDEATFNILDDDTGNILPLEKFFQFALRRTGGLKPTTNVIRGFLGYAQMLEKKRSLDELIPKMDIYAQSLTPEIYTPRGLEIDRSIKQFVNKYINNKKGRHIRWIAKQGGTIDVSIRGLRTFTTMMDLGLNIPTGVAAFVGEQVANFEMLGTKGYTKGTARIKTAKGKAILDKYEAFVGRSAWEEFRAPGKQLTERISDGLFGLFHEASVLANKQFLLGVLTEAEYNSGEVSAERLAEIRLEMGRFRVVPGTKSLVGSTSAGSAMMQYKTWAAPIIRTLSKNAVTMTKDLGSKPAGEALTTKEAREIYRFIALSTTAVIVGAMAASDDDDESFTGQLLKKMYRESMTLLQGVDPTLWLATPRIMGFLTQLGKNLKAIATLEEYKQKPGLKGVDGLQRQLTPRAVKQVLPEKKKTEKL